jgi:hypothetical protein
MQLFMSFTVIKRVHSDLFEDKIDYKQAYEILKALPKPWTTKEWKEQRNNIIKNRCEVCNSHKGPFVLQHTRQPKNFCKLYDHIALQDLKEKTPDFETKVAKNVDKAIALEIRKNFQVRDCCPECHVVNIRSRKTMRPKYVCANNHSFENPISLKYYKNSQTTEPNIVRQKGLQILPDIIISKMLREFASKNDLSIGKRALLICLLDGLDYWSFKYTKTACKKCSFLEDQYFIFTKGIPHY